MTTQHIQRKRNIINRIAIFFSMFAMLFGLFWLAWILWTTLSFGMSGLSWSLFTEMTPPPNEEGGIANAIVGSMMMVGMATVLGAPLGILAGIFLAEYGQTPWLSKIAALTRFLNDILLSAPSIVIGLFVYILVVMRMGNFSGIAGMFALALLEIPIVIRTTENMLRLVPNTLREAAYALGTPKWRMILHITIKASIGGVMTGILLAIARVSGETAPLLFTALSNQFWSVDMTKPIANLPVMIYQFALSPYTNWQELAWAGVFLITLGVLVLNIIARLLAPKKY